MASKLRMLRYAVPYWRGWIVIVATMLAGVGMNILKPWPTALLIDNVLGSKPLPASAARVLAWLPAGAGREGLLLWVTIGTVGIFLLGWIVGTINGWVMLGVGQRMTYDVGADLFLHLQKLSLLFHSKRSVADSINRVNGDTYCVQTLITGVIMPFVQSVVTLIAMFGIMWRLDHKLTLLSLISVPFMMLAVKLFSRSMWQRTHERRELEGRMMGIIHIALSSIPAVQAFTREELEHSRFRKCADETVAAYQRGMIASMAFNFAVGLVTTVGTAGMMWLGGRYALQGKLSPGVILLFLTYLSYLYGPLNSIMYTASTWQSAAANSERVLELLEIEQDVKDAPNAHSIAVRGHVQYENVSFGYDADRPVIHGVSFEAHQGEVVAIVGPTGAGKTTLVNLLMRFFDPWSGRVTVDGHDLRELRTKSLREQVSMVLQEPFIFPYTASENIAYGKPDATADKIESAARAANADAFIRRLPNGYDTVVGERGATLSGGEKQRLSIARAFVKDAPILILDEPTSALDARTESMLLEALDRLMEGRTTFIIAHRLSTIRNADRILVIDQGRIIEQGRHAELMNLGGLYATLYRHQMDITRHEAEQQLEPV